MNHQRIVRIAILIAGAAVGYYFGFDHGSERATSKSVTNFQQCMDAGYPVMESYPRQCNTPDGRHFVEVIDDEPVACTADARQCPDGSYVGRTGPNCEFVCP